MKPGRKVKGHNSATAKRQAGKRGYLGTTDHLRAERQAVKFWAEQTEQNGHFLGRADLFRRCSRMVHAWEAQLLAKQANPGLTEDEAKVLTAAQERLKAWQSPKSRENAMSKLLEQTCFSVKQTGSLS